MTLSRRSFVRSCSAALVVGLPAPLRSGDADHRASLSLPAVRDAIARGRDLIVSFGEQFETTPVGGTGLREG